MPIVFSFFLGYAVCFSLTESIYKLVPPSCFLQDNPRKSVCHASKVPVRSVYLSPMPAYVITCAEYKYFLRQHTARKVEGRIKICYSIPQGEWLLETISSILSKFDTEKPVHIG